MPDDQKAAAFAQFEKMGEDEVRLWIQFTPANHHSINVRLSWAKEWLAKIDQQTRLRNEASQAESLEIAKSAKDAAWVAAEAAREAALEAKKANTIATLAMIGAVIAIAVSIVGIFLR